MFRAIALVSLIVSSALIARERPFMTCGLENDRQLTLTEMNGEIVGRLSIGGESCWMKCRPSQKEGTRYECRESKTADGSYRRAFVSDSVVHETHITVAVVDKVIDNDTLPLGIIQPCKRTR